MRVNRKQLRKLVHVTLECLPEDMEPEEQIEDAEALEWIRRQLEQGNEWAWCTAHVVVNYQGLTGDDWLGGCSYESEANFAQDGGYYESMVGEAVDLLATKLEALATKLEALANEHDIWEHDPIPCIMCAAREVPLEV